MTTLRIKDATGTERHLAVDGTGAELDPFVPIQTVSVTSPPAAHDLFGRLRFSSPAQIFASTPSRDLNPLEWQHLTSGAGNTITWNEPYRAAVMTLAAAGYDVRQSYRYVPYEPGRPFRVVLTGNAGTAVAGVTREWGQFDAANGVFWRRKGDGSLAVCVRSSTSGSPVDLVIDQADWNGEALTINPANNNVWVAEYVWLGAFAVRFGLGINGQVRYVHTQEFAGELPHSYMQTASLPVRYTMYADTTPATPATMQIVCSMIESEGGYTISPSIPATAQRPIEAAIAVNTGGYVPIVAIRPALLVGASGQEITNRVQAIIENVEVYATAGAQWAVFYYPPGTANPLTGGAWAKANTASSVEANASATALSLTGGIRIASGFAVASGTGGGVRGAERAAIQQTLPLTLDVCGSNNPLTSNVGANPGYFVLGASGTGNVAGTMNVREI